MKQEDVAGKILVELLARKIISEDDEFTTHDYLMQAYAAGYNFGRRQIKRRQPVAQYDTNGTLVKIWDSAFEASTALQIPRGSIYDVVNGKIRKNRKNPKLTAGGYMWRKVNLKNPTAVEEKIGSIQVKSIRQVPKIHASKISRSSQ